MLSKYIFGTPLSPNGYYQCQCCENHQWEIYYWDISGHFAECPVEGCSVPSGTLGITGFIQKEEWRHADFTFVLVFKFAQFTTTATTETLFVGLVGDGLDWTLFVTCSAEVVLFLVGRILTTCLTTGYIVSTGVTWRLTTQTNTVHWGKTWWTERYTFVLVERLSGEVVLVVNCRVEHAVCGILI